MCSLAWHPFAVEAGASGAIFGIAGALIASFYFAICLFLDNRLRPPCSAWSPLPVITSSSACSVLQRATPHTLALVSDWYSGYCWRSSRTADGADGGRVSDRVGLPASRRTNGYVVPAEQGRHALTSGQSDGAIRALTRASGKTPSLPRVFPAGPGLHAKTTFPAAETAYLMHLCLSLRPATSATNWNGGGGSRAPHDAWAVFSDLAKSDQPVRRPDGNWRSAELAETINLPAGIPASGKA